MPKRPWIALLAWVALFGCAEPGASPLDGSTPADASAPNRALRVEGEGSIALTFGAEAAVSVRYTDAGGAVAGETVRFALEGVAHDSTLSDLAVATDAEGRATASLRAGSTVGVFRVRISAERAALTYVDVSVGNAGFGGLRVDASYEGARTGARRVVRVVPEGSCETEPPASFGLSSTLEASNSEAWFRALPAGERYAVLGSLEGPTGVTLARACVADVQVEPAGETQVSLRFEDLPLQLDGRYAAAVTLSLDASSTRARERLLRVLGATIDPTGSDGGYYLDALERELRARGADAAAATLALDREREGLDGELDARLGPQSPTFVLDVLADALGRMLVRTEVAGPLSVRTRDDSSSATWGLVRMTLSGATDPTVPPVELDLEAAGLELAPTIALRTSEARDHLFVESLSVHLPLGTISELALLVAAERAGYASVLALLEASAGCEVFASWLAEQSSVAAACDDACAEAVCRGALDALWAGARAELLSLDEERDRLQLRGDGAAVDDDGDLEADAWRCERLEGAIGAEDAGTEDTTAKDGVTARLAAVRVEPTD